MLLMDRWSYEYKCHYFMFKRMRNGVCGCAHVHSWPCPKHKAISSHPCQITGRPSAGRGGMKREKCLSNETKTSQRWHVSHAAAFRRPLRGSARKIDANIQALLPDEMIRLHHLLSLYLQSFSFTTMLFLLLHYWGEEGVAPCTKYCFKKSQTGNSIFGGCHCEVFA